MYRPPVPDAAPLVPQVLVAIAQEFSPRFERRGDETIVVDVSGLERLFGHQRAIGEQLRREAADRGVMVHVAVAPTPSAAIVLAYAHPGVTVVDPASATTPLAAAAAMLAPLPIGLLERACVGSLPAAEAMPAPPLPTFRQWGLKTLGDLAALPSADLSARLGRDALLCQAIARGDDGRPLVPEVADERFDASLDLEWPIEALEALSFVLTRLLEPVSIRLERRDRGAAVLHVQLTLITGETYARRLELPTPIRDVRTLRTLALLDLEAHPPSAAIDRVAIVIDPTPGRVLQHTLFARPHPTPERLSTLLARLGAVMGQDRIGAPATVDTYRPGAFTMEPFATEHSCGAPPPRAGTGILTLGLERRLSASGEAAAAGAPQPTSTALRRCRHPVPARVIVDDAGRPVRVTSDRRGFAGGAVVHVAGPWRVSGAWWGGAAAESPWDHAEWDVALNDGAVYRIYQDRLTDRWFMTAIVD